MPMKGKKSPADRLRIFDLRVDGLSGSPMIGNAVPHLAWKIAGAPGTLQGAYRVCASSEADLAGEPDLWDSGWVESEQSVGVPWGGAVLGSRQRVFSGSVGMTAACMSMVFGRSGSRRIRGWTAAGYHKTGSPMKEHAESRSPEGGTVGFAGKN